MSLSRYVCAADRPDARRLRYLGDGVYAVLDGAGRVWLTAENGVAATDAICLEPEVAAALVRFLVDCGAVPKP
jgi:hypothetical protein